MTQAFQEAVDRWGLYIKSCNPIDSREGDWVPGSLHYRLKIKSTAFSGKFVTEFTMGPAHCCEPTLLDVLHCIMLDASTAQYGFEEFCANLGYDSDSIKAYQLYKRCSEQAETFEEFAGPSAMEEITEASYDY